MKIAKVVLGIVLFLVFWAFQVGYMNSLGTAAWFAGAVIFSIILFAIGKVSMPNPSDEIKEVWMFAMAFALVSTFMISFLGPYLGAVFPPGFTPSMLTPLVLSFWLIIFGGAKFVTGWLSKNGTYSLVGLIWLFSAIHFVTALSTGPNSYLHFGLVTALPVILTGLMGSKGGNAKK